MWKEESEMEVERRNDLEESKRTYVAAESDCAKLVRKVAEHSSCGTQSRTRCAIKV